MNTMIYNPMTFQALLANTLCEKVDSYTVQEMLKHYPNVVDLLNATEYELQQITGIGSVKAALSLTTILVAMLLLRMKI